MNQIQTFLTLLVCRHIGVIRSGDRSFEYFKGLMWAVFSLNIDISGDDTIVKGWLVTSAPKLKSIEEKLEQKIRHCAVMT